MHLSNTNNHGGSSSGRDGSRVGERCCTVGEGGTDSRGRCGDSSRGLSRQQSRLGSSRRDRRSLVGGTVDCRRGRRQRSSAVLRSGRRSRLRGSGRRKGRSSAVLRSRRRSRLRGSRRRGSSSAILHGTFSSGRGLLASLGDRGNRVSCSLVLCGSRWGSNRRLGLGGSGS